MAQVYQNYMREGEKGPQESNKDIDNMHILKLKKKKKLLLAILLIITVCCHNILKLKNLISMLITVFFDFQIL